MKHFKFLKICIVVLSSLFIVSIALAGSLPKKWTEINPIGFEYNGLTPSCSNAPGTPDCEFTFFVKGGQKNNLVIFFQGGGGCWDYMNCVAAPTYTQYQSEELYMFSNDMAGRGIFDQTRKDNPFKDWGFVYIPYCTGDLFWGANDANYYGSEIRHRGFVNFQAVLDYLKKNTNYPGKIFVTGSSAGGYGATLAFPYVKKDFQWSNVYLLGDASNGVLGGTFPTVGILNWNVQMPDWIFPNGYDPSLTMPDLFMNLAAEYPWSRLAQYTTNYDEGQIFFLNVMININNPYVWEYPTEYTQDTWHNTMLAYADTTAEEAPNYRYYIADGTVHTILMSPKFYTEESAGGKPFVDWISAMISTPNKWENLKCATCVHEN
jgi:hypothetical protein